MRENAKKSFNIHFLFFSCLVRILNTTRSNPQREKVCGFNEFFHGFTISINSMQEFTYFSFIFPFFDFKCKSWHRFLNHPLYIQMNIRNRRRFTDRENYFLNIFTLRRRQEMKATEIQSPSLVLPQTWSQIHCRAIFYPNSLNRRM